MKKIYLFTLSIAIAQIVCAQSSAEKNNSSLGTTANPTVVPMNGNGSLGQTYSNAACGLNYIQASKLVETRYDAYTTAGNYGCGLPCAWSISGLPGGYIIDKAYVWALVAYQSATAPTAMVTITNPVASTSNYSNFPIGTDGAACWGETGSAVYRWDVTASISGNGTYTFDFSGFTNPTWEIDGATLFIIYRDLSATYQGSLDIWDGAVTDGQSGAYVAQTMTGLNVCATPSLAKAFAISADHQDNIGPTHNTTLNGAVNSFPNSFYNFDEANAILNTSQTTSLFAEEGGGSDCWLWGAMGLYYQTTNCVVCSPCTTTSASIDSVINVSACTTSDGAIYISDSTSAPPLTYSWSNGATTQDITGLSPGSYSVTVTDTTGCFIVFYATIGSPSTVNITLDSTSANSCISNNGVIFISVSGGTAPYTYSWSNGSTTQDITGLAVGNYSLTVTDSIGCTNNFIVSINTTNPIVPNLSFTPSSCNGNTGIAMSSPTGGTPPYTYLWSNGQTTSVVTGLTAGTYSIIITDTAGCSATSAVTITFSNPAAPAICMVTADSLSQYNMIIWDKTSFSMVDSFIVYREIATNNYQPIGAVPYASLSLFVDTVRTKYFPNTGNPNAGTYRYKIQLRDSCGNYSALSPYHNTIFMTGNNGNFSWQLYTIENGPNPVSAYVLMRDDYSNGNWNAINSVSGTQQTVSDPAYSNWQSTANYRIQTLWGITCAPSRLNQQAMASFNASKSNISGVLSSVNETSLNDLISIYPNPTTGIINVSFPFKATEIFITDVVGKKVFIGNKNENTFDISAISKGIYFLSVRTENGIAVRKIVKE